ncbi:MAG: tetratricopeptide repeat protein, partial [Planctomycetaceae bacterium]
WVEKLPYLALGLAFMVIAARIRPYLSGHLGSRLAVAGYATWFYPAKTLLPVGLTVYYLPREGAKIFQPFYLVSALGVVGLTVVAARLFRRWPGLMAAWACYLAILAPNSGLVRTGESVGADRYSYVASIPLFVLLAGGLCRWATVARPKRFASRVGMVSIAGGVILGLGVLSWHQAADWQNPENLWTHALENGAEDSVFVHTNLGGFLSDQGRFEEALAHHQKAVALRPDLAKTNQNLGLTLARAGQLERPIPYFLESIRIAPADAQARRNFALALMKLSDLSGAEAQLAEALRLRPGYPEAHNDLGIALLRQDRRAEAIAHLTEAVRLRPGYTTAGRNLRAARTLPVPQPGHSPGSSANRKPSDPLRHRPPRDEVLRPAAGGAENRRGHVDARVVVARGVRRTPTKDGRPGVRDRAGTALAV